MIAAKHENGKPTLRPPPSRFSSTITASWSILYFGISSTSERLGAGLEIPTIGALIASMETGYCRLRGTGRSAGADDLAIP